MTIESALLEFHPIREGDHYRKIAYTRIGQFDANDFFICLPGLLETRESFHPLLELALRFDKCCWLSIDYCGRGSSDPLPINATYSTSKYLADIEHLLEALILPILSDPGKKLHLIGTSMGGILAMHIVKHHHEKVASLFLNDIGLFLQWSALVSLYHYIQDSDTDIRKLNVDNRAIEDVHKRSHFDLPYEFDFLGMQFYALLKNFNGQVVVLHNANSPICPLSIANKSKSKFDALTVWTLEGDGHPAHWEENTVNKLGQFLKLATKTIKTSDKADVANDSAKLPTLDVVPAPDTSTPVFVDTFINTSKNHLELNTPKRRLWLIRLKNWLRLGSKSHF